MRAIVIFIAVSLAVVSCSVGTIADPCAGIEFVPEKCELYRAQLRAQIQEEDQKARIQATKTAAELSNANILAQAEAQAALERAQSQAEIDRANAELLLTRARIEEEQAELEAAFKRQEEARKQRLSDLEIQITLSALSLQSTRAANEETARAQQAALGIWLEFILRMAFVASLLIIFWLVVRRLDHWLHRRASEVRTPDGRLYLLVGRTLLSPALALQPATRIDDPAAIDVDEAREIKHRDQRIDLIRAMQTAHVIVEDEGDSSWQPAGQAQIPEGESELGVLPPAPPLRQLLATWRPGPERMLLAYGADGPIYGRLSDLLSTGIVGRQGQGKTTLLRFVYAQCILIGAKAVVWDLHDDVVDELPGAQAFTSVAAIDESAQAMRKELDRRIQAGLRGEIPIMIMVDEFNAVAAAAQEATETCNRVILEGRKYGMFCMLSAKGLPSALFGGSTVRDSLSSHVAFNTSVRLASQLGFEIEDARRVRELRPGYALFDGPVSAQVVTFPDTSAEDIKALLPASQATSAASRSGKGSGSGSGSEVAGEVALEVDEERREQVRQLLKQATPANKIIREVWGVTGGNAYQRATQEFSRIVASLIG